MTSLVQVRFCVVFQVYLKKKQRNKYAGLLDALKPKEEEGQNLEITFIPGLKDIGKKILEEKEAKEVCSLSPCFLCWLYCW